MSYNFDETINRIGTHSFKYDAVIKQYNNNNMLGMRIADTDFAAPQSVLNALQTLVDQKSLGYGDISTDTLDNIIQFYKRNTGWAIDSSWISFTPGIVPILGTSLLFLTQVGDQILTNTPAYPPLMSTVTASGREILTSHLLYNPENGKYQFDFADMEKQITPKTKMFLLCNPHNPTGKVWSREELKTLGEFCLKHQLLIIADEIHGFLNYPDYPYTPMASLSPEIAEITISCFSPGKLFDIPGVVFAFAVISNPSLQKQFAQGLIGTGAVYALRNNIGLSTLRAAYLQENEAWLASKIDYLQSNAEMVDEFCKTEIPVIKPTQNEGSFIKWLNFSALGLEHSQIEEKLIKEAEIAFLSGQEFGNSDGFFRMNIGCTKKTLAIALERLKKVFGRF